MLLGRSVGLSHFTFFAFLSIFDSEEHRIRYKMTFRKSFQSFPANSITHCVSWLICQSVTLLLFWSFREFWKQESIDWQISWYFGGGEWLQKKERGSEKGYLKKWKDYGKWKKNTIFDAFSITGWVRPSFCPLHTSWISENWAEYAQNSIRNMKLLLYKNTFFFAQPGCSLFFSDFILRCPYQRAFLMIWSWKLGTNIEILHIWYLFKLSST